MQQVKSGDKIKIHYHGTLSDSTVFDSSLQREPLEFEVGSGMVIPGFDIGVMNMVVGDKKTIHIPFMEAYGPSAPEMIMDFPRSQFPQDLQPEVGMQLQMNSQEGQQFPVVIVDVSEEFVKLDGNHPLAGKDLTFDLELVEIL
ncbi:MAG: peptidylprolyl isomerase [Bacteroidetes bacterium]|jgi:peptidylprolyl isomerase|nr:peptidylprolyl isomerase [Bacteroidota bacterium]